MFYLDRWYRRRDFWLGLANYILPEDCLAVRGDRMDSVRNIERDNIVLRETIRRLERALAKVKTRLVVSSARVKTLMDILSGEPGQELKEIVEAPRLLIEIGEHRIVRHGNDTYRVTLLQKG